MTVEVVADTKVFRISLTIVMSGASNSSFGVLLVSQTVTYNRMLTTFVPHWVALSHNQTDCYPTTLPPTLLPRRYPSVLANHGRPVMHPTKLSKLNRYHTDNSPCYSSSN